MRHKVAGYKLGRNSSHRRALAKNMLRSFFLEFDRKGYIAVNYDGVDEENIFDIAVEAGAEEIEFGDDLIEIYADLKNFGAVQEALKEAGIHVSPTPDRIGETMQAALKG